VQSGETPLWAACDNGRMEVVKLLLAHPGVDINKATEVRGRGGVGRERVQGGQRSWVHTRGCGGGGRLTSHSLTMLSWGALLGGYMQDGWTPLFIACANDHKEVVKLLLAHPGVDINKTNKVRGREGVGRERGCREDREAGCTLGDAVEGVAPHIRESGGATGMNIASYLRHVFAPPLHPRS
jgi:ankyrin repeat protein